MLIVHERDVLLIPSPNGNATNGIVTAKQGATEVRVTRQREDAGGFNPPHIHDHEEVMIVRGGSVTVEVGEEAAQLGAGDIVVVPPHTLHRITNTGGETGEWLLISPAGTRFFRPDGEEIAPSWDV